MALAYIVYYHLGRGTAPELLWICNVSTLMLGVGLVLAQPPLVKTAVLWLIVGTPLWLIDAVHSGEWHVHSFVTHLVGPVLGVMALRGQRPERRVWWIAVLFFCVLQLVTRLVTPPELNINVSHHVYPVVGPYFSTYAAYWTAHLALFSASLFGAEWAVDRVTR